MMRGAWALAAALLAPPASAGSGRAIERSVSAASLVVVAEADGFIVPSGRAVFRVSETLKGESAAPKIIVDLEKAPVDLWPGKGERTILCLARSASGKTYELASHPGSLLPAAERGRVLKALGSPGAPPSEDGAGPGEASRENEPPRRLTRKERRAARVMARQAAASDTVVIGSLSEVPPAGEGAAVAAGAFTVQEALLGYGGYAGPITVRFPGGPPEPGRYLLFLRGSLSDGTFAVAPVSRAVVPVPDEAEEKRLKRIVCSGVRRDRRTFTTIQATVAEWQQAWNAKDLERCMRCYGAASDLRGRYDRSPEGRKELKTQLRSFPGRVDLSIRRISLAGAARRGASPESRAPARDRRRAPPPGPADVGVLLRMSVRGVEDSRAATMKFVYEDGEWLILDEGF